MRAELFQRPEIYYYRQTAPPSPVITSPPRAPLPHPRSQALRLSILNPAIGLALIVPALVIPFIVAFAYGRRRPAELELLAHYRGHQVTLFVTSDQQQFGQLSRALVRAAGAAEG